MLEVISPSLGLCEGAERGDFPLVSAGAVKETESHCYGDMLEVISPSLGLCEGAERGDFPLVSAGGAESHC